MRCGKTEELAEWLVDEVTKKPEGKYIVATSTRPEGEVIWARVVRELLNRRLVKRSSRTQLETLAGGQVRLFVTHPFQPVLGMRVDEAFVSNEVDPLAMEAIRPTVKPHD